MNTYLALRSRLSRTTNPKNAIKIARVKYRGDLPLYKFLALSKGGLQTWLYGMP